MKQRKDPCRSYVHTNERPKTNPPGRRPRIKQDDFADLTKAKAARLLPGITVENFGTHDTPEAAQMAFAKWQEYAPHARRWDDFMAGVVYEQQRRAQEDKCTN